MKAISLIIAAALFAVCAAVSGADKPALLLGMLPIVDNLPFYVAEKQNLFAQRGVDVKLVPFQSAVERDTALRAGAIDGMLADMVAAQLLEGTGCDIAIVSVGLGAVPSEGRFAVLAAPDSGISSMKDLKGVRVGISANTIIEYVLDGLMRKAGLKQKDVAKLDVPKMPVRTEMLLSGQLKAAVLPDPMAAYAEARGARLIADDTKTNLSQTVIVFRRQVLDKAANSVKKLMAAYDQAVRAINSSPEDYRKLLVSIAGVPGNISKTFAIDKWSAPRLPTEDEVRSVANWMVSKGLIKAPTPYGRLVAAGYAPGTAR